MTCRDVTELLKLPRAVFVPWPMGHHFGVPFHRELQRRVLIEAFRTLETASESGTIQDLIIMLIPYFNGPDQKQLWNARVS